MKKKKNIYIYIERERERERESTWHKHKPIEQNSNYIVYDIFFRGNFDHFIKNALNQYDKHLQHWRNILQQDCEIYYEFLGDDN